MSKLRKIPKTGGMMFIKSTKGHKHPIYKKYKYHSSIHEKSGRKLHYHYYRKK